MKRAPRIRVTEHDGEIQFHCRALAEDRIEVTIEDDGAILHRCMRLVMTSQEGLVVCDRLVRSTPARIEIPTPSAGRYSLRLLSLRVPLGCELTWSDWKEAMGIGDRRRVSRVDPASWALLDVA